MSDLFINIDIGINRDAYIDMSVGTDPVANKARLMFPHRARASDEITNG